MPIPPLSDVSSKYGAPMGRCEFHLSDCDVAVKFHLVRLPLVGDGVYDAGGAYWGSPSNLWRVVSAEEFNLGDASERCMRHVEFFLRAPGRDAAKAHVRRRYPNARFFR